MMGKAKRSGEITIPTDRVRALAVYWLRADVMHSLVLATEDAWLERLRHARAIYRLRLGVSLLEGSDPVAEVRDSGGEVSSIYSPA